MSTTTNGFYAVNLSSRNGQGFAMVILRNGQIIGADATGVILDGNYAHDPDNGYQMTLIVKTPPNIPLLQGGLSGPQGETQNLNFPLPIDFASRDFVRIDAPRGPINAKFVKLRDLND